MSLKIYLPIVFAILIAPIMAVLIFASPNELRCSADQLAAGMGFEQVATLCGPPRHINFDKYPFRGIDREQWIYSHEFILYFEKSKLESVQIMGTK